MAFSGQTYSLRRAWCQARRIGARINRRGRVSKVRVACPLGDQYGGDDVRRVGRHRRPFRLTAAVEFAVLGFLGEDLAP